jgi:hypothetical protein
VAKEFHRLGMLNEINLHKAVKGLPEPSDRESFSRLSGPGNQQGITLFGIELR